jgi:hypothetical protein
MKNRMTFISGMLFLLPLFLSTSVSAQFMNGSYNFNNPISSTLSTLISGKINEESMMLAQANKKKAGASGASKSTVSQTVTQPKITAAEISKAATFRPTSQPLKIREIANQLASTPEEKEQTFTLFSQFLTYFAGETKRLGKPNDFPLALSVFLAVNSSLYHGTPPPDDAHLMTLRDIIAEAMAENSQLAAMTDRDKQELYEVMIIYTLFTQGSYDEAKKAGNQGLMDGYRKVAGMNLQTVCKKSPDTLTF